MKKEFLEQLCGFMLLLMVFLVVKYGVPQAVEAEVVRSLEVQRKERPVIVIDVGHGGSDPGKVGVDGSLEKDINLQIALRLKTYLEQSDVSVVMTREEDIDLHSEGAGSKKMADMRNRCQIINDAKPDLVVSIHQNSYHEEAVKGAQVFYYSTSEKSKGLAEILQRRFKELNPENRRNAKGNDSYFLLKKTVKPIVIVECGFLSNREEAEKLSSALYQEKMAWNIYMGIMQYLNTEK